MEVLPTFPAKTVPEFIAYAKANPGKINMASGGVGGPQHVAGELFKYMAGVDLVHVPYHGTTPALIDLMAGQVQVMFDVTPSSLPHIKAGKLRPLAVTTPERIDFLPGIPAMAEFLPGYEAFGWIGFGAPKDTPAAIIDTLNKAINAAVADPDVKAHLLDLGVQIMPPNTPAEFAKFIAADTEKWIKVVQVRATSNRNEQSAAKSGQTRRETMQHAAGSFCNCGRRRRAARADASRGGGHLSVAADHHRLCRSRRAARPTCWRAFSPSAWAWRSARPSSSRMSTGAAGSIGVARVVRSPADGYTLSIGTLTTHVLIGALYKLPFDLLKDLAPIAEIGYEPLLICVKNSLPVKNLQEFIAWLKANPGKANAGIPGVGSTGNLAGLAFQKATGTKFQFVPYRGDGPAVQDLVAGHIDLMIEPSSNSVAQVQAGTISALAVPAKTRHPGLPDVPTTDEAGLPGFYASIWFGLWAPKDTPKDIIAKLNAATVAALADPDVKDRLGKLGQQVSRARPCRRRRRSAIFRKQKPRNGGRSSRTPISRLIEFTRFAGKKEQHRDVIASVVLQLGGSAAALAPLSRAAFADTWPSRIVKLEVGFPPGGGLDSAARIVASRLSDMWGQHGRHREQARRRRPDCHGCRRARRAGRLHDVAGARCAGCAQSSVRFADVRPG